MSSSEFVPLRKQPKNSRNASAHFSKNQAKLNKTNTTTPDTLRSRHGIEVDGTDVPNPITSFDELAYVPYRLKAYLRQTKRLVKPTPVQMQAIGCLQESRDVICLSGTGTGKTLAYLLPLCSFLCKHKELIRREHQTHKNHQIYQQQQQQHKSNNNSQALCSPLCLVIVPTRELMHQVLEITKELVDTVGPIQIQNEGGGAYINTQNLHQNQHSYMQHQINFRQHFIPSPIQQHLSHQFSPSPNHPSPYMHQPLPMHQPVPLHQQPLSSIYPTHQTRSSNPNFNGLKVIVTGFCGGTPVKEDVAQLKDFLISSLSPSVLVATPGRLLDLTDRNVVDLSRVRYFVIDECDRILDMGMEEQLRRLVAMVTVSAGTGNGNQITNALSSEDNGDFPTDIRTSLWSATLPESLERIARSAVVDPVYVCCGIKNSVPQNIRQEVKFVHTYQKRDFLLEVLRHETAFPPVIVFASSKDLVEDVTLLLQNEQFHAAALHSGYTQEYRNSVVRSFRGDEIDILVATDLASRGLDVPAVTRVINYDTPDTIEDYVHRVGRTGRFGREGHVTTFLTLDCRIAAELRDLLEASSFEGGIDIPPQLRDLNMFGGKILRTEMGDRVM